MATSINDGVITARVGVDGPAAWLDRVGPDGTRREEQLRIEPVPGDRPANPAPVGVLIGPWTMSSGELIALAFRGRARLFGEPTAGLTTVTDFFRLSDGSLLILPIAHMADRAGWMPDGPIAPDVLVVGDAWPSEHDAQASAAREWVLRNAGSPGRE